VLLAKTSAAKATSLFIVIPSAGRSWLGNPLSLPRIQT
jgi:hypothetical protein